MIRHGQNESIGKRQVVSTAASIPTLPASLHPTASASRAWPSGAMTDGLYHLLRRESMGKGVHVARSTRTTPFPLICILSWTTA